MAEKKQSVLALIEILRKYSDEDHILSIREIQNHLSAIYDISLDRRTLYSHMDLLKENGYEVSTYEDNGKGYYLIERQFEKGEVLLLCNAIHASHFISEKQSDELIRKLLDTQSRYQRKEFKDRVYMANPLKTSNRQLLLNIEIASEAIRDRKQLSFIYLRYNSDLKLVPRREDAYIVEPLYIVYADSRPYLIVTSRNHEGFIHYRLDRMSEPAIVDEKVRPLAKDSDPYEYARNKLFMYSGEMRTVTFRCLDTVLDHMIDIFGTSLFIAPEEDHSFLIRVKVPEQGALYLAQQFMENITIVEPEELRQRFKDNLKRVQKNYK
ncbi:MAG: WYL domain-containing protein [Erysipelotrichaceae bacterium]|nr:WYL domain-containing protein [Erysipelotrichaceae bacterium]